MNTRKFTYITTLVLGMFLFVLGTVFLFYINTVSPQSGPNAQIPHILSGLSGTKKNPMNFLLLVGDKASGNTDSMMVANYNPETKQVSIVTIPRDTRVTLKKNILPKINAAYAAGGREHKGAVYASEIVSNLTGININYYVHINISSIKKITDMLGGVYFDVPADLRYVDPTQDLNINLKKGYQLLGGSEVEQLLRFRKPSERLYSKAELKELTQFYDGSDIKRTEMQVKFIKEFISQKLTLQYLPRFNSVINYAFENIITNMTLGDALKLTSGVINVSTDNFNSFRLDGQDKIINGGWFYVYNEKIINIDTKESLPADEIVSQYFRAVGGIATPTDLFVPKDNSDDEVPIAPAKSTKKPTKNPSNSDTDSKGNGTDKP